MVVPDPNALASASPTATAAPSPVATAATLDQTSAARGAGAPPDPSPIATDSSAAVESPKFTDVLGDFGGGERSRLARHGFTVNGRLGTEAAANVSGGLPLGGTAYQRGTSEGSEFAFGINLDFNRLYSGSGAGTLHFLLTTRFGTDLSATAISNPLPVEEIFGDGTITRITFLDYEQPFAKGRFLLRLGKYNQQDDFVAGYTYWGAPQLCFFYVNENLCGVAAANALNNGVVADGTEGYVYYPSSQWGARLRANLSSAMYVQAAAIQANPIVNGKNGGLYFGFHGGTGVLLPLEIGLRLNDRKGNLQGTVRIGGYYDTSEVQDFATRATGSLALVPFETNAAGLASNAAALASIKSTYVRGRSGAYVQVDHMIEGSASPGRTGTALLASAQYGDPQSSFVSSTFDLGLVRYGTFPGRAGDTLSVAFVTNDYNVRLQRLEQSLQLQRFVVPNTVQNQVVELDYGIQANSWLTLRPGVQYLIHPGGITANPGAGVSNPPRNALVIGIGGYLSL